MFDVFSALFSVSICGVVIVIILFNQIFNQPVNDAKANKIATAISSGAMTFLREEYKIISIVLLCIFALIIYIVGITPAIIFALGSIGSMFAGFIGMRAATGANVRTTMAAKNYGERSAFLSALFGGGVMGFTVATIGLLGLTTLIYLYEFNSNLVLYITCFNLGASLVAFFARIGGGIFTKSADVGADLVGKIEIGIPEDDPRNPAVIADNVGDCVGDTAGMGADIYESYVGAMVSAITLALLLFTHTPHEYIILPLVCSGLGLIGSAIGLIACAFLKLNPAALLRNSTYIAIAFLCIGSYFYIKLYSLPMHLFVAIIIGCITGIIIGLITEYYTGSTPIKKLAQSCESGAATNIIYGLSIGMESVAMPVFVLSFALLGAYEFGGKDLYGTALAAVAMLATIGISMTVDAYGPIADNAGGIAEMAGFGKDVRAITDKLDSLGNTTAAIGKGFAIGSALMTALAMFGAYAEKAHITSLNVLDPLVMAGIFIGGTMPFIISAMTMRSVSNAAWKMVIEVRRQFATIKGLLHGDADPDYERCIAISTQSALREMIMPGIISIALPIIVFYSLGVYALGGVLVGTTISGVMLALMMANGGGAWDNAKKYIEAGNHGGKGSPAHTAAIIGDTVGDPFKDTSGPALNILIKLMSVVALMLVSL